MRTAGAGSKVELPWEQTAWSNCNPRKCSQCRKVCPKTVQLANKAMLTRGPYEWMREAWWCATCIEKERVKTLIVSCDTEPGEHKAQQEWTTYDGINRDISSLRNHGIMWESRGTGAESRKERLRYESISKDVANEKKFATNDKITVDDLRVSKFDDWILAKAIKMTRDKDWNYINPGE